MNRKLSVPAAIVLAASFVATGVPREAAGADEDVRLVVILASGWRSCTERSADCPKGLEGWQETWDGLAAGIRQDLSAAEVRVEPFVYSLSNNTYTSCDTNQTITVSAAALHTQAARLLLRYPNADLMIVGHSLGGVVATYWKVTEGSLGGVSPSIQQRFDRSAVVTLDSPVAGLDWTVVPGPVLATIGSAVVKLLNCGSAIPDDLNLTDIFGLRSKVGVLRQAAALDNYHNGAAIGDAFIHFPTAVLFGKSWRAFSSTPTSCLNRENVSLLVQITIGPVLDLVQIAHCLLDSHGAILSDPQAISWVAGIARDQASMSADDDVDHDGLSPPADACPSDAGPRSNDGCPELVSRKATTTTVFAIDVSDSMRSDQKLQNAKAAATAVLQFIEDENRANGQAHRVGVVAFATEANVDTFITEDIATTQAGVRALATKGNTNIVAALRESLDLMPQAVPGESQFLVLMTDGNHTEGDPNYDPLVADARARGVCIYTLGFGKDVDEQALEEIAAGSGCGDYAFASAGAAGFDLLAQYIKVRHRGTGSLVLDEMGTLREGERRALNSFTVAAGSGELVATLAWPGSAAELILTDPSGRQIDESYTGRCRAKQAACVTISRSETLVSIFVNGPVAGEWTAEVRGIDVPEGTMPFYAAASVRAGETADLAEPRTGFNGAALLVVGGLILAAVLAVGSVVALAARRTD